MSFETKKIIEDTKPLHRTTFLFFKHLGLFLIMFFCGMGIVYLGVKGYDILQQTTRSGDQILSGKSLIPKADNTATDAMADKSIINALIVGVGGKGHRGAYNTDTMIVVSYNKNTKQVNMISLPRDLYINIDKGYYGRINSVLDYYMSQKNFSTAESLDMLKAKVGNLIGQDISYYGMIDFKGFEHVIDTLGGVEVDVPEELYDPSFPIDNFNYGVLSIASGKQIMDGNTALNYARSRHSTSDFDRSRRQQIIIKALLNKLLSFNSITKIKSLYGDFNETVKMNAGLGDIVRYLPYLAKIDNLNSIVFQSDCPETLKQMRHGCVLYSPPRESFGGAAVLLPRGATPKSISDYTQLFTFVNRVIYYPFGQFEKVHLGIYNSIDPATVTKNVAGMSTKLGVELIRNGLEVQTVGNNALKQTGTTMILLTGDVLTKKQFASYNALVEDILTIGNIQIIGSDQLPNYFSGEIQSGVNMILLVGSDSVR